MKFQSTFTERFRNAARVIVMAHRKACLIPGNACSCAVGNMVAASQNASCTDVIDSLLFDKLSYPLSWGVYPEQTTIGYNPLEIYLIEAAFENVWVMSYSVRKEVYSSRFQFADHLMQLDGYGYLDMLNNYMRDVFDTDMREFSAIESFESDIPLKDIKEWYDTKGSKTKVRSVIHPFALQTILALYFLDHGKMPPVLYAKHFNQLLTTNYSDYRVEKVFKNLPIDNNIKFKRHETTI